MRSFVKVFPWLVLGALLLIYGYSQLSPNQLLNSPRALPTSSPLVQTPPHSLQKTIVTRVVDGDTIVVGGNTKVRYIGINSPEASQCFGFEASQANKNLTEGKQVKLEYDVQHLDKYGRTLAYVWSENTFVNEELVREGFAQVSTYPPNVKYVEVFKKAEREARENNRGLWAPNVCTNSASPLPVQGIQTQSRDCQIKGNINSKGEKIYHVPGQRYYEKTQVDEGAGERWFCSEREAEAAGWRKSKI